MSFSNVIIRFSQLCEQEDGAIKRLIGFVKARYLMGLFGDLTLDANPRSAKRNSVVEDIIESLRETPDIFQFKTKGILLGTTEYEPLDRRRFRLHFDEPAFEGVLDGGHNMLAIGIYMLEEGCPEEIQPEINKIKYWEDFQEVWRKNKSYVENIKEELTFNIPVELLVPSDMNDEQIKQEFKLSLADICAARNNNAQLTTEAKANQRGFYETLRNSLPEEISKAVEWKTNEWEDTSRRPIKVRDIIAFSWIPLSLLEREGLLPTKTERGSPLNFAISPQKIYASKGELVNLFDKLMEHPAVSKATNGPRHELHNSSVGSAFQMVGDLVRLYDEIYKNIGAAYNANGGKFGAIKAVKIPSRKKARTPYLQKEADYIVPDGFILPILYGLRSLMFVNANGEIKWSTDPFDFIDKHLTELMGTFKMLMEVANFDPQKVAKNEQSYRLMEQTTRFLLQNDKAKMNA